MSQWKSPLLLYAPLSSRKEQVIQEIKRNVIDQFEASGFKEIFTLAIPLHCKLKRLAGRQSCHGHHDGALSISRLGTKDPIIAKLSKTAHGRSHMKLGPATPQYWGNPVERTLTFGELCEDSNNGKALDHPFDEAFADTSNKASSDTSNAEHNLGNLVKWYDLASHVVDVTTVSSVAFAKSMKRTVQSFRRYKAHCIACRPRTERQAGHEKSGRVGTGEEGS
jgi:hypothetical protein